MTLTYGFFNSVDGDRKYHAEQMTSIFDGVITDGVFASIGHKFTTIPGTGMQVIVQSGRAWFNHTWTLNDGNYTLNIDAADSTLTRIDSVILEVDHNNSVRGNSIKILKGTAASSAKAPTITNVAGALKTQYRLANITVSPKVTSITADKIVVTVGQSECPLVTSVLQQTDITELYKNWNAQFTNSLNEMKNEFDTWFADIQTKLSEKVITNLQQQITENATNISSLKTRVDGHDTTLATKFDATVGHATNTEVTNGNIDTKWVSPSQLTNKIVAFKPTVVQRYVASLSYPQEELYEYGKTYAYLNIKPMKIYYPQGTKYLMFSGLPFEGGTGAEKIQTLLSTGNMVGPIFRDYFSGTLKDTYSNLSNAHAAPSLLNVGNIQPNKLYVCRTLYNFKRDFTTLRAEQVNGTSNGTYDSDCIAMNSVSTVFIAGNGSTNITLYPVALNGRVTGSYGLDERSNMISTDSNTKYGLRIDDVKINGTDGSVSAMNINYKKTASYSTNTDTYYITLTKYVDFINILKDGVKNVINTSNAHSINDDFNYAVESGNTMLLLVTCLNGYAQLESQNVIYGTGSGQSGERVLIEIMAI